MWWAEDSSDHERGGFQNRDVGKTSFDNDYGPEYGIDYARFSDAPDLAKDAKIFEKVSNELFTDFAEDFFQIEILVRNGFVILIGPVHDEIIRKNIGKKIMQIFGVTEVINQLSILNH